MHAKIKNRAAFDVIYTGSRQSTRLCFSGCKESVENCTTSSFPACFGVPFIQRKNQITHIILEWTFLFIHKTIYHQTELLWQLKTILISHRFIEPWKNIKDTWTQRFHMKTFHHLLNRLKYHLWNASVRPRDLKNVFDPQMFLKKTTLDFVKGLKEPFQYDFNHLSQPQLQIKRPMWCL